MADSGHCLNKKWEKTLFLYILYKENTIYKHRKKLVSSSIEGNLCIYNILYNMNGIRYIS